MFNNSNHKVNENGIIISPGKFEGEPLWVPYFWDKYLEGWSDTDYYDNDILVSKFIITDEDRQRFPDLKDVEIVELWEDDRGFVYSGTH